MQTHVENVLLAFIKLTFKCIFSTSLTFVVKYFKAMNLAICLCVFFFFHILTFGTHNPNLVGITGFFHLLFG